MKIPFWTKDPSILLNKQYLLELWPTQTMTYEEKLNAISRLVILLTILGFIFTLSFRIILVGVITLIAIFILFNMQKQKAKQVHFEGFSNSNSNDN